VEKIKEQQKLTECFSDIRCPAKYLGCWLKSR